MLRPLHLRSLSWASEVLSYDWRRRRQWWRAPLLEVAAQRGVTSRRACFGVTFLIQPASGVLKKGGRFEHQAIGMSIDKTKNTSVAADRPQPRARSMATDMCKFEASEVGSVECSAMKWHGR